MRGDETQLNATGEDVRTRTGPRHAAPRKSLLTKLHIPAGKAFALAAMPTAVFVGMGLTPKLALADDSMDIPFAPGPCVTRSDEPSESPSPSASETKSPSPSPSASESGDKGDAATPKPSATPSAGETVEAEPKSVQAEPKSVEAEPKSAQAPAATPSASPTPTKSTNPLDPLGVGDALKDLFDGPAKETASPSPSATTASPKPSESDAAKLVEKPVAKPVEKATDAAKETVDKTAAAIRDAAEKAGKPVEELDESVKGLDAKKDEDIPDGAKERFPCPTADPEALAAADLEQGIPLLPNEPWILESSMLTLGGLDYKGIVEVKKGDGTTKKVLKFTAKSVDIKDLHQLTVGPAGTTGHVEARKGSTSTIRNGTVTMYTEELKGNLFGLIPVTFSPQTPPPLNVPFAFFSNVKVTQAGQFGGTLKVPGLHNYFTGGNS
ncbi:hypothetical protein OG369_25685 [Streptomyces sp. NBC_01221]|uniref:hypothetical protein n=1 Tax=unclassified Streptomyces TaxID=2593676 RepID=UPI00225199F3|nr:MULTISPECIES: hypothetical protein [unclassified Streptomyces]MCX4789451.1 hypothetical protein [Streptomyces sp. NBC_01221]MCX4794828.1 hypothetical protein [Streptomyces sp. NBC_01242]WSP57589.1 hypothetical protein OG306_26805 [Streptomyces sp. NBC_01241]